MDEDEPLWDFARGSVRGLPGVRSMTGYRALGAPEPVHRGLPSARLTWIVARDDGLQVAAAAEDLHRAPRRPILLTGLTTSATCVHQRPGQSGVQLDVHPLAARRLFGISAAELSRAAVDDVPDLGGWGIRLHEQLTEATTWAQAFALLEEVSAHAAEPSRSRRTSRVRPELVEAWRVLERNGGDVPVTALAAHVGLTGRRLGTLFHQEVGHTVKTVARLIRFDRAVDLLSAQVRASGRADLAATARAVGCSDQPHLNREFRRFAGISPAAWIAEEFRNIQDGGHMRPADWSHE